MKSFLPKEPDPGIRYSKTGLRDVHRRGLIRLIFLATSVTLALFAILQFFNGNQVLALVEVARAAPFE